jgi:molybdate transport system substrate-binding protein
VIATFGSGLATKAQVVKGDPFDVAIVQLPYPDVLASGHVVVASETSLVSTAVGIAVRSGQRKPDISSPDAVRRSLLAAKSVAYPNPADGAAAGVSFDQTLKQLGIAEQMQSKLVRAQGGVGTMAAVAKGDAELGVTFVSEMRTTAGVDVVGPLPAGISPRTSMSGFLSVRAKSPDAARAFLQFLASPEATAVYRSLGMEPPR